MRARETMVGYALLLGAILGYGTVPRALTIASHHTSGLMTNALRSAIAALVLLALVGVSRTRLPRGRVALWMAFSGVFFVIYLESFAEATIRAGAGNTSVLAGTSPVFVLVLGRLFLGERPPRLGVLGVAIAIGGATLMVSPQLGGANGGRLALGMTLATCAAAAAAANILLMKRHLGANAQLNALGATTIQLVGAGVLFMTVAFAWKGTGGTSWSSGEFWGVIVYLGAGALGIASLAFFASLGRLPATTVSSSTTLVPVVAVLIEAARGNLPGGVVLLGMALAVGGVALVVINTRAKRPSAGPTITDVASPAAPAT